MRAYTDGPSGSTSTRRWRGASVSLATWKSPLSAAPGLARNSATVGWTDNPTASSGRPNPMAHAISTARLLLVPAHSRHAWPRGPSMDASPSSKVIELEDNRRRVAVRRHALKSPCHIQRDVAIGIAVPVVWMQLQERVRRISLGDTKELNRLIDLVRRGRTAVGGRARTVGRIRNERPRAVEGSAHLRIHGCSRAAPPWILVGLPGHRMRRWAEP